MRAISVDCPDAKKQSASPHPLPPPSPLVLKEYPSRAVFLAIPCCMVGVVLTAHPRWASPRTSAGGSQWRGPPLLGGRGGPTPSTPQSSHRYLPRPALTTQLCVWRGQWHVPGGGGSRHHAGKRGEPRQSQHAVLGAGLVRACNPHMHAPPLHTHTHALARVYHVRTTYHRNVPRRLSSTPPLA